MEGFEYVLLSVFPKIRISWRQFRKSSFSISKDSFHNRKYHLSVANSLNLKFFFSACFPVTLMTGGDCEIFDFYFLTVIRVDSRQSQAANVIKGSYFRKRYFPILAPYICNYDVITIFVNVETTWSLANQSKDGEFWRARLRTLFCTSST